MTGCQFGDFTNYPGRNERHDGRDGVEREHAGQFGPVLADQDPGVGPHQGGVGDGQLAHNDSSRSTIWR
jgi:hypothetical protein